MTHNRLEIFTKLFNEIESKTNLDKATLKIFLSKSISKVYQGVGNALILEDGTISVPTKLKDKNELVFKDYVVSQKKASEILLELEKLIKKEVVQRDIAKYLKEVNKKLVVVESLILKKDKYYLKLTDEKRKGFLKDFIFHIRADDLLPNDLKNITSIVESQISFKVLVCANKYDKKLIFCRRFCKEVLIDIFESEFKRLNEILGTNYSYSKINLTYNVKEKYVGYQLVYKDSASSFFKKTLMKNLRNMVSKNLVIGYKKISDLKYIGDI